MNKVEYVLPSVDKIIASKFHLYQVLFYNLAWKEQIRSPKPKDRVNKKVRGQITTVGNVLLVNTFHPRTSCLTLVGTSFCAGNWIAVSLVRGYRTGILGVSTASLKSTPILTRLVQLPTV